MTKTARLKKVLSNIECDEIIRRAKFKESIGATFNPGMTRDEVMSACLELQRKARERNGVIA